MDKDEIQEGFSKKKPPLMQKTPIDALQADLDFYRNMQIRIKKKDGIYIDPEKQEETEAKLQKLQEDLGLKIVEFETAIEKLR